MPNDAPNRSKLDASAILAHCGLMPQWTPEQARSYKEIASKARTAAAQARKIREKLLDKLVLEAANRVDLPKQEPSDPTDNPLLRMRLNNVNERIKECDQKLQVALADDEINGGLVKNLAMALGVLDGIEQRLSGRPSPGSFKPVQPKVKAMGFTPPADS